MGRAVEQDPFNAAWRAVWSANLIGVGLFDRAIEEATGDRARRGQLHAAFHPGTSVSGERTAAAGRHRVKKGASGGAMERRPPRLPRRNALPTRGEGPRGRADSRDGRHAAARLGTRAVSPARVGARRGRDWYEKMIEHREPFAVLFARSPLTEPLRQHPRWSNRGDDESCLVGALRCPGCTKVPWVQVRRSLPPSLGPRLCALRFVSVLPVGRNLAEGFYRYDHPDFANFTRYARASLGETQDPLHEGRKRRCLE